MTSDDDGKSLNRRHFLISASTLALAGCTSPFGRSGSDLPPPNYEEDPNGDEDESEEPTNPQDEQTFDEEPEDTQTDSDLSQEATNFFTGYKVARQSTLSGIQLVREALNLFNDREFEEGVEVIIEAQQTIQDAREVVLPREVGNPDGSKEMEYPDIWQYAENMNSDTDLNLTEILENMERAIKLAHEASRAARDADTSRQAGEVEAYRNKMGQARIKLSNAEFYVPETAASLESAYKQDKSN